MLEVENLEASYGHIAALKRVSLKVAKGKIVSIIGTNGAGKTTLLRAISGMVPGRTGSIRFAGAGIEHLSANEIVGLGICHVPEGRQLFSSLSVKDNLDLGAYLYQKREHRHDSREMMESILSTFPVLSQRLHQIAGTLSGGEQQMLAIGRALMARPTLLLLDEPSLGLAPKIVEQIFAIIKQLNKAGTTILLVEQNARLALGISDYAYVLETGTKVLEGTGRKLLRNANVRKAYLGLA